jgi:hypothetical protein
MSESKKRGGNGNGKKKGEKGGELLKVKKYALKKKKTQVTRL